MQNKKDKNKKLLIIEDDEFVLRVYGEIFKNNPDFNVLIAKNGEEGLQTALKEHPDMLLADLIMPKMDGIHMIQKIREDSWGKNAKIIVLTNLVNDAEEENVNKYGIKDYWVKSDLNIKDLVDKIKAKI